MKVNLDNFDEKSLKNLPSVNLFILTQTLIGAVYYSPQD